MSDEPADNHSGEILDPAQVTIETFQPHMGNTFVMNVPENPDVELSLIATIDEYREANGQLAFRRPFSLVFEADDGTVYRQSIRQLRHPLLGSFEVFVVPFGIFEGKARYNVLFC